MENKGIKITRTVILGFLFIFAFLFAISISGKDIMSFWVTLGAQVFFAGISYIVYKSSDYQDAYGFNTKTAGKSLLIGIIVGVFYLLAINLIPGLSIGIPLIPQSISTNLRFFVVNICAPIMETIFFLGALLVFVTKFNKSKKWKIISLIIVSIFFALFHLGAVVTGIYDMPGFEEGFTGFSANISFFISAFIFNMVAGYLVIRKDIQNLLVAMPIHFMINFTSYLKYAVMFG